MSKSIQGIVNGKSIQFDRPLGLPDGAGVEVVILPILSAEIRKKRLEELFGSCRNEANDLDAFLLENSKQRRLQRPEFDI
jgi:hypothetical protein